MKLINDRISLLSGNITIGECECSFIFDVISFELSLTGCSLNSFGRDFVGKTLNGVFVCQILNSDQHIAFYNIRVVLSSLTKYKCVVEAFAIYISSKNENIVSNRIDFRGDCVDTVTLLYRATQIESGNRLLRLMPISEFSFDFDISENERIEFSYEYKTHLSRDNRKNSIECSGLQTLFINNTSISLLCLFEYYKKMIAANRLITNKVSINFMDTEFAICDEKGDVLEGEVFGNLSTNYLNNNYLITDFDTYKEGLKYIYKEAFNNHLIYTSFLRDEFGDVFTYERQFKLFAAFDHYYKENCDCISYSEPIEMKTLKNDLISLIDDNKDALEASKKRKDYLKSIKRSIVNYDNSMATIIESILAKTFICDNEIASSYSDRMNDYRNGIVHGHDFERIDENEEKLSDKMSYFDFVIYQRLLLYIILYSYRKDFDLIAFCKQLYAL